MGMLHCFTGFQVLHSHDPPQLSTLTMVKPSMGPEPTLISRKEVDALYETLGAIVKAFNELEVAYIVTGGSTLYCQFRKNDSR